VTTWERDPDDEFEEDLDDDALDEDRQAAAPAVTIEITGLSLYTRHGASWASGSCSTSRSSSTSATPR
jgi:hypothetical protein